MQRDIVIKGRNLGGSADLTLLAPIKAGFVDSLESVTYKTRVKRVLETLHGARMAAHEHATARLLSDAVERVGAIHSVRVAVLEPEDKVLLAVSFDGSWEAYIRVLWEKVGTLLDLIFCGTIDYVTAHDHSFDEWLAWARRVQVETGFYYGSPDTTARDALYQRRLERMRVRGEGGDSATQRELDEIRAVLPSAEGMVERLVRNKREAVADDPAIALVEDTRMVRERIRNGLQGLAGLYRLVDMHRPSTPDGDVLRFAAIDLLREFVKMHDDALITQQLFEARDRFARQLDWLFPDDSPVLAARPVPPGAERDGPIPASVLRDLQGGIVRSYNNVTHGLLLMLAFDDAAAAAGFFAWLKPRITRADQSHEGGAGIVFRNVALTPAGLRAAGMDEDTFELFPEEFRQGMAARAGSLGDVRNNHPRRWRLPRRFVDVGVPAAAEMIELDTVHAVLQLRCGVDDEYAAARGALELHDADHPLRGEVAQLRADNPGARVLAVEAMNRNYRTFPNGRRVIVEHFGYADGDGQPQVEPDEVAGVARPFDLNRIHLGELVHGHGNAADSAPDIGAPEVPEATKARMRWLANGSFLVMRKYRQFVDRLDAAVARAAEEMGRTLGGTADDYKELVHAKLMGRYRLDGQPLTPAKPGTLNNFLYNADPQGALCPLHAHIRRAHPRLPRGATLRQPRLMRRSMSYGPTAAAGPADAERGLVFMAYNADLGEQFEVVQRWLAGGNSTGASSAESCPILGVPENGLARHFRFEHAGHVFRVELEQGVTLFDEPPVLTRLEWGLYLFTPSLSALEQLRTVAATAAADIHNAHVPWQLHRGRQLLDALKKLQSDADEAAAIAAWKAAIEDPESIDRLDSAALWAAIRQDHGGVLKSPYGTLVADRELMAEVFLDAEARYSVCGQLARMKRSFGEISLGMDAGPVYQQQSASINQAIEALSQQATFDIALGAAHRKIDAIVAEARKQAVDAKDKRFEVGFEAREVVEEVLATLCEVWFGLQDDDGGRFRRGGVDWAWQRGQAPLYPGHFTAMSRYMFQPHPGPTVVDLGERYGQALREAMRQFVADHRLAGTVPRQPNLPGLPGAGTPAPIAEAAFNHALGTDDDFVARTTVGVLMGFNPTIIGALLNVIREWQRDGSFGALRATLAGRTDFAVAEDVLRQPLDMAARMRPMPQIGWRTVLKPHRLGKNEPDVVDLVAGDRVVMALVSGTQQSLADLRADCMLMFGGDRSQAVHPTHACPGYQAALGALLGTLTALLARPEVMRQGVAPLTFVLEGDSGYRAEQALRRQTLEEAPKDSARNKLDALRGKRSGLVLAWGDSWLDYSFPVVGDVGQDIRDCLQRMSYLVPTEFCRWTSWPKIRTMAASPDKFCTFVRDQVQTASQPLRAILLSAGGNDSTQDTLRNLLNPKGSAAGVLDLVALGMHIEGLHQAYREVLKAVHGALDDSGEAVLPVLVHGYDHPFPVGRSGIDRWLYQPFKEKGYDARANAADKASTTKAMRDLIDALNDMLRKLPDEFPSVRYVDLRKTIEQHWPNPESGWSNDLHPVDEAFALYAMKIDEAMQPG